MTMTWVLPEEKVIALLKWAHMPRHIWTGLSIPHRIGCVMTWYEDPPQCQIVPDPIEDQLDAAIQATHLDKCS